MYARAALLLANVHASSRRLFDSQSGSTAIEYGLIVTFIAIAMIASAGALGSNISELFVYFSEIFSI